MRLPEAPSLPQQLDIFADSRDVMLRNDLVQALLRRDPRASRRALADLADEYADDALLAPAQVMLDALTVSSAASHSDLPTARQHLENQIVPAARRVLGAGDASAWLAPLWRDLAQRHAHLTWNGNQPNHHAAPLWLAAAEWAQAEQSVASIASWRRIPEPLAWMAQARYRQQGLDAVWPLLAELAWLAPQRLATLWANLADPLLNRLRRRFDDNFDPSASYPGDGDQLLAWLPAWMLTLTPALASHLAQAEPGQHTAPEQGMRQMLQLLGLERQGRHHELMAQRKLLRDLSAPLYAAYMATR